MIQSNHSPIAARVLQAALPALGILCVLAAEARAAGVVIVKRTGNKVLITGDNASNQVVVWYLPAGPNNNPPQKFQVIGDAGTTVRGDTNIPGFGGDVEVQLNGGDDNLRFTHSGAVAATFRSLVVNMGTDGPDGSEKVFVSGAWIYGGVKIRAGGRKESIIRVHDCRVDGTVDLDSGDGNDIIEFKAGAPKNYPNKSVYGYNRLGGDLQINTRGGDDTVVVGVTGAHQRFECAGKVVIGTGAGNDRVAVDATDSLISQSLTVSTGEGNDVLGIYNFTTLKPGGLDGGAGTQDVFETNANTSIPDQNKNRKNFEVIRRRPV